MVRQARPSVTRTSRSHSSIGYIQVLGDLDGLEHFRPRHDAELTAEPLLIGRQNDVDHKRAKLLAPNHLFEIEIIEAALLRQRLKALLIEFDADAVGLLALNHLPHEVGGFLRHMRCANQDKLAILDADADAHPTTRQAAGVRMKLTAKWCSPLRNGVAGLKQMTTRFMRPWGDYTVARAAISTIARDILGAPP